MRSNGLEDLIALILRSGLYLSLRNIVEKAKL
jgi:hypothetical protein